jgi:hypothetical protein
VAISASTPFAAVNFAISAANGRLSAAGSAHEDVGLGRDQPVEAEAAFSAGNGVG